MTTNTPTIIVAPAAAESLAASDRVSMSAFILNWESLTGVEVTTLDACRERLIRFAGSAVLADESIGPAPYAECVCMCGDEHTIIMHWGTCPDT